MTEFVNSYQFVDSAEPLAPKQTWRKDVAQVDPQKFGFEDDTKADGHAVYEGLSGRIFCSITLEFPTVVGGSQISTNGDYRVVLPYLFKKRPAIPATSTKGLISSIVEAASRSRYRVLKNSDLTVAYYPDPGVRQNWTRAVASEGKKKIGKTHTYFDKKQIPLAEAGGAVSPADALFGFVRENAQGKGLEALAGKLKFSHAQLSETSSHQSLPDFFDQGDFNVSHREATALFGRPMRFVRLKEQGTPMKPPKRVPADATVQKRYNEFNSATPNFYFKKALAQREDEFISKREFAEQPPEDFKPMGRKFYAHHVDANAEPWRTRLPINHDGKDRKAAVLPLKKGLSFCFHVDYDNLSEEDLNLLCFALRPSERFRHKIGLGRGLGLGSVQVRPIRLEQVDRRERYEKGDPFAKSTRTNVKQRISLKSEDENSKNIVDRASKHFEWLKTNDAKALAALLAIGERHNLDGKKPSLDPVLFVPLKQAAFEGIDAPDAERNTFGWFQENDLKMRQKLRPIRDPESVPTLNTQSVAAGIRYERAAPRAQQAAPARWASGVLEKNGTTWLLLPDDDPDDQYELSAKSLSDAGLSNPADGQTVEFQFANQPRGGFQLLAIRNMG